MGKVDHLTAELLSALADQELDVSAMRKAREHLAVCESCSAQVAAFERLDAALAGPIPVACLAGLELRSGLLDGELSIEEARVATAHLAGCEGCRAQQAAWTAAEVVLRRMPSAQPSLATDARVARLTAPPPRPRSPFAGPTPLGLRAAVGAVLVLAIAIGLLPTGSSPEQAQQTPQGPTALVAGVQQVVLYTPTNTLYVIQAAAAAVDALDASSYALRARISVGSRPTALALNEVSDRVLVIDAADRSLVEIDPRSNTVVATTQIPVGGTPTGVQVEAASGRIIVAAIADPPLGGPAPTPTVGTAPSAGIVAVLDATSKKLETVKTIEVAPTQIVSDPDGKRTLLISRGGTTILDGSLKPLGSLPGGIAGAFGAHGLVAVLGAEPGNAVLYFMGGAAPAPLRIPGTPAALTPLPDGGFAVLLASGRGDGRIVVVDEAGEATGVTEIAQVGRDLTYDHVAKRFTVLAGANVVSAPLPGVIARPVTASPGASAGPSVSGPPSNTSAPVSPAPSVSVSPSAQPSPSSSPASAPPAVASAPPVAAVPPAAKQVAPDVYRIAIPDGRLPILVASTPGRIWFLDDKNGLNALDTATGDIYPVTRFPRGAQIRALAADHGHVYAVDPSDARLYTLTVATEQLRHETLPLLRRARSLAVADTGVIWVGLADGDELLSIDPVTHRLQIVNTGVVGVASIAPDGGDRVWFTDGSLVGLYDIRSGSLSVFALRARGSAHLLLPDRNRTLWVGTTAGEVLTLRDGTASLISAAARPITSLSLDRTGAVWALAPSARSASQATLIPQSGLGAGVLIDGPVINLSFTATGRAWIADASGGFYLVVEPSE